MRYERQSVSGHQVLYHIYICVYVDGLILSSNSEPNLSSIGYLYIYGYILYIFLPPRPALAPPAWTGAPAGLDSDQAAGCAATCICCCKQPSPETFERRHPSLDSRYTYCHPSALWFLDARQAGQVPGAPPPPPPHLPRLPHRRPPLRCRWRRWRPGASLRSDGALAS